MPLPIYPASVAKTSNDPARVVVVQFVLEPPTVTVAVSVVLTEPLVVIRTCKVWPEDIEPDVTHAPPLTLIWAVAAPETETDEPPAHPEMVIVAVLLVTDVFNDCEVRLVNDNPLGEPQEAVLAAIKFQFVPSQNSILVSVVL
jgi:hypothetical protein